MAYTVTDLTSDVRNRLDDSNFSSTLITQFLNDTQREIFNRHRLDVLEGSYSADLTIDTHVYNLPAAVQTIETFRITDPDGDEKDLTGSYMTIREFDNRFPDPAGDSSGEPYAWTIREDNFYVYPKPDVAYTVDIRYIGKPTELTAGADVPELPERYREALILGVLHRAHKFNDDYDLAQFEQSQFESQLLDINVGLNARQSGKPHVMRVNGRRAA